MITKLKTSNREEWKALRNKYIGGSDAAAVVGLNPHSSAYSLWAEKTGKLPGFAGNLATEVGTYLEDFVAQKFAQKTGKKVRRCNYSLVNSQYPFAIANIDREIIGEDAGLEIKTTDSLNLCNFKNGEYPDKYYAQCVHYMAVTGKQRWYLAVLIGNREFLTFEIERDEEEISSLMQAEARFWELVKKNIPPAPDGTKSTTESLLSLYPNSADTSVDLFGCAEELEKYIAIDREIKALEKEKARIGNAVKLQMEDAEKGACDRFSVSWKANVRRTFDIGRFAADHPKIELDTYFNETNVRPFKVIEKKG